MHQKKKDWIEGGGQSGDCTDICLIKEVHKMLMTKFYSGQKGHCKNFFNFTIYLKYSPKKS